MNEQVLYEDKLVTVFNDSIVLKHYAFFWFGTRQIRFADIRAICVELPTLRTGKWRIQGTGDLNTWYPLDWNRPSRDRIFLITLNSGSMRVGFTVERSTEVIAILQKQCPVSVTIART